MLPNVILRLYRKLICRDTCRLLWLHILTWAVLVVRTKYGKSGGYQKMCFRRNDETLKLVEDVLGEIIQIFPSEYIHVGGDECPKVRWAKCPKCQARIKALGLKSDRIILPRKDCRVSLSIMQRSS